MGTCSARRWTALLPGVGLALLSVGAVAMAAPRRANAAFPGRNGRISYIDGDARLLSIRPAGGGDRVLASPSWGVRDAAYKPDGREILFDLVADDGAPAGLFLKLADGRGRARPLTRRFDPKGRFGADYDPNWSPDGQSVVFTRQYVVDAANGNEVKRAPRAGPCKDADDCIRIYHRGRTRALTSASSDPVWSTRGLIALTREDGIWVIRPDGSGARRLVGGEGDRIQGLDWSPDGRRLIFNDACQLKTVGADGNDLRELGQSECSATPAYSPNGRWIVYDHEDDDSRLWRMDLRGRSRRRVRTREDAYDPDWQPLPRRTKRR